MDINDLKIAYELGREDFEDNKIDLLNAYREGIVEGLRKYAWWKDGVQYVGTCGTTLDEAIEKALQEIPR